MQKLELLMTPPFLIIKEQTRGRKWVPRPNSKKGAKQKMLFAITQDTQRISHQKLLDRRNNKSLGCIGFSWSHRPCHEGCKGEMQANLCTQTKICCIHSRIKKKTTFLSFEHRFKKDCCCWSISTSRLPKTQLAAAATIAAAAPEARALAFDHKKLPTLAGLGVIPCEKTLGGVTTSGMIGQREINTNGANLCRSSSQICFRKEASATKDGNLPVTDGRCKHYTVHNGTFPAFAHSNTHAVTYSLFFLRDSNTTLDIDDEQATVTNCKKTVNAPAQEASLAILPNKPLLHPVLQLFSSFARVSQRSFFPAYIYWTADVPADAANILSTYDTKSRHRLRLPQPSWDRALPHVPYFIIGALDWTPFPCTAGLGKNPINFHVPNSLGTSHAPVILVVRTPSSLCSTGSLLCL